MTIDEIREIVQRQLVEKSIKKKEHEAFIKQDDEKWLKDHPWFYNNYDG